MHPELRALARRDDVGLVVFVVGDHQQRAVGPAPLVLKPCWAELSEPLFTNAPRLLW